MNFVKDPDAVLDYRFDWAALTNGNGSSNYLASGEVITSHTVTATTGITVNSSSIVSSATAVVVWLAGGTARQTYDVTCRIVTSDGRTDDRTIRVMVAEQ